MIFHPEYSHLHQHSYEDILAGKYPLPGLSLISYKQTFWGHQGVWAIITYHSSEDILEWHEVTTQFASKLLKLE